MKIKTKYNICMNLKDLIKDLKVSSSDGPLDIEISGIAYDSRKVKPGDVFVAIPGTMADGTRFIPMAVRSGARAVITEKDFQLEGKATKITVPSARAALADISGVFYGHPSRNLRITGITGTNGKTTTAYLIDSILKASGKKTAVFGTVETRIGEKTVPAVLTTPESLELQQLFVECVREGVTDVVMEVSSHSLFMKRVRGVEFDRAVYTNLSHDHLDFHKTLEAYFDAKLNLFRSLGTGAKKEVAAIINTDDGYCEAVIEEAGGEIITYSLKKEADASAKILSGDLNGSARTP